MIDQIFHDVIYRIEDKRFKSGLGPDPSDPATYKALREEYHVLVLGNDFEHDSNGVAIDFRKEILHSQNKSTFLEVFNENGQLSPYLRDNLILMGDIIEDCDLADNHSHYTDLKIGFLNDYKSESDLKRYLEHYDVVVTNDGPYTPANMIM